MALGVDFIVHQLLGQLPKKRNGGEGDWRKSCMSARLPGPSEEI